MAGSYPGSMETYEQSHNILAIREKLVKHNLQFGPYFFNPSYHLVPSGVVFSGYKTMSFPNDLRTPTLIKVYWDRDRGAIELARQAMLRESPLVPTLIDCFLKPYRELAELLKEPLRERRRYGFFAKIPEKAPMQIAVMPHPNHLTPLTAWGRGNPKISMIASRPLAVKIEILMNLMDLIEIARQSQRSFLLGNLIPENLLFRPRDGMMLLYDFHFSLATLHADWETPWTLAYQKGFYDVVLSLDGGFSDGRTQGNCQKSPFQATDIYTIFLWINRYLGSQEVAYRKYAQNYLKWPRTDFLQRMERLQSEKENRDSTQKITEILQDAADRLPSTLTLKTCLLNIYEEIPPKRRAVS